MCASEINNRLAPVQQCVGEAVGVEKRQWFVAIVGHNTEKASKQRLEAQGYDCYVASQQEVRVWRNGRRAKVDRVVIPSTLFIHCSERERRNIVALPYINRFMTDRAKSKSASACRLPAVIPDQEIATLRFMLDQSDTPVTFSSIPFGIGAKVRVIRGKLAGLEGEVLSSDDADSDLYVGIDMLGYAKVTISPLDLEII